MPDRKFAVWEWSGYDEGMPSYTDLQVRMKWAENVSQGKAVFYIKYDDPMIDIESGNLEELRQMLDRALRDFHGIVWNHYLWVYIGREAAFTGVRHVGGGGYASATAYDQPEGSPGVIWQSSVFTRAFAIQVEEWEQGTRASDGERIFRQARGRHQHYTYIHDGELKNHFVKENRKKRGQDGTGSLIEDTPENREALAKLSEALGAMIDKFEEFLNAKNFASFLEGIKTDGIQMLTTTMAAPKKKQKA